MNEDGFKTEYAGVKKGTTLRTGKLHERTKKESETVLWVCNVTVGQQLYLVSLIYGYVNRQTCRCSPCEW